MISIPVRVWLPSEVKILDYHLRTGCTCCSPTLTVKFESPTFVGEIETDVYANGKIINLEEGKLTGHYKYSSPLEWKWNYFEFYFKNPDELEKIFRKILSGEAILEEAELRKTVPPDIPENFKDGYGPEIFKDILNAYQKLFGKRTYVLVSTQKEFSV